MRYSVGVSTGAIHMGFSVGGQDRGTEVVLGINRNGQACKKCITKGDFCHLHVHQMHARFGGTAPVEMHDGARHAERNCLNRGEVFYTTHNGETPKKSIKQNKLRHQHPWQRQDGVDPRNVERLSRPTEHVQCQTAVFGVTKRNESCKRCIKKNDFCYQHASQRRDDDQIASTTTPLVWDDDNSLTTTGNTVNQTKLRRSRQSRALARNMSAPVLDDEPFWQLFTQRPSQLHRMPSDNVVHVAHVEVHSNVPGKGHWNTSTHPTSPISTSVAEDKECCICMETVTSLQNHKELRCCNNTFHQTCLSRWRQSGSTCPICRASL